AGLSGGTEQVHYLADQPLKAISLGLAQPSLCAKGERQRLVVGGIELAAGYRGIELAGGEAQHGAYRAGGESEFTTTQTRRGQAQAPRPSGVPAFRLAPGAAPPRHTEDAGPLQRREMVMEGLAGTAEAGGELPGGRGRLADFGNQFLAGRRGDGLECGDTLC